MPARVSEWEVDLVVEAAADGDHDHHHHHIVAKLRLVQCYYILM